jgi:hypothetical protein
MARLSVALFATVAGAGRAGSEPKYLPRSIYVPVELALCEHLQKGVLYQDDLPISTMPARRIFQFTYYPDLGRLLPEGIQIKVEGTYRDGSEPFVARLAVTPYGVHNAHGVKPFGTLEALEKRRGTIDVRLDESKLNLACQRFCRKSEKTARTRIGTLNREDD